MRKASAVLLAIALGLFAALAWWSMLAAERAAIRVEAQAARRAAVTAAVAVAKSTDVPATVALAEAATGQRMVVRDGSGRVVAGTADPTATLQSATVSGSDLTVGVTAEGSSALGIGRYSHVISAVAFLIMAAAIGMLALVTRDRRRARAEVSRLEERWTQVAAADDVTGLGNRTRLLEDVDALIARGSRYGNTFGLALFEVPEHADVAAAAAAIAAEARSADVCYRVDDRRFVTLLPEQDETGAALAAARVRRHLDRDLGVDVSSGVSAFLPWLPCDAVGLLERADLDLRSAALLRPEGDRHTPSVDSERAPVQG